MGFVRINIANPLRRLHARHARRRASSATISASSRRAACACRTCATTSTWLLKDTPGWSREQIDAAFEGGQRIDARLAQPVNVYWAYMTAWATPDGLVQFRDDIYNKDGLGNAIPVASRVPTAPDEEMFLQN